MRGRALRGQGGVPHGESLTEGAEGQNLSNPEEPATSMPGAHRLGNESTQEPESQDEGSEAQEIRELAGIRAKSSPTFKGKDTRALHKFNPNWQTY